MAGLAQNRWVQEASGYVVAAVLAAVLIAVLALAGDSSAGSVGDRVFLTSGGTVQQSGQRFKGFGILDSQIRVETDLPLTASEAVAAGWKDPIYCATGKGRFFQKVPAGEGEPYSLMYNGLDELIGVYLFTVNEMPDPWKRMDKLLGGGGLPVVEFEHWGMYVFSQDPTRACGAGLTAQPGTSE